MIIFLKLYISKPVIDSDIIFLLTKLVYLKKMCADFVFLTTVKECIFAGSIIRGLAFLNIFHGSIFHGLTVSNLQVPKVKK